MEFDENNKIKLEIGVFWFDAVVMDTMERNRRHLAIEVIRGVAKYIHT